ncbi:hypothetical protein C8R45DRAFT_1215224 [Mycena sanguinolenta]|nr:hypothetical protein C8R45DRAFT_1215224 [Mycena sanguinolenta]
MLKRSGGDIAARLIGLFWTAHSASLSSLLERCDDDTHPALRFSSDTAFSALGIQECAASLTGRRGSTTQHAGVAVSSLLLLLRITAILLHVLLQEQGAILNLGCLRPLAPARLLIPPTKRLRISEEERSRLVSHS